MAATTRRRPATWVAYLPYLLPGVIAFAVVIGYPLVMNVYYSLFRWKGGLAKMNWYGLGNYADLLSDDVFWVSFRNSLSMDTSTLQRQNSAAAMLRMYIGK